MTDNTAGPHLARIAFASILSYPPTCFRLWFFTFTLLHESSHHCIYLSSHIFIFFSLPSRHPCRGASITCAPGTHFTEGPRCHRHCKSSCPSHSRSVPSRTPGSLNRPMSMWIFACLFGSRLLSLYNGLVVHFSTPTLLFLLPLALPYLAVPLVVPSTVACSQIFLSLHSDPL
jgi:hypothetical protein